MRDLEASKSRQGQQLGSVVQLLLASLVLLVASHGSRRTKSALEFLIPPKLCIDPLVLPVR